AAAPAVSRFKGLRAATRRPCQRPRAFGCSAYRQSGSAEIDRRRPKMQPTFSGRARGRQVVIVLQGSFFCLALTARQLANAVDGGVLPLDAVELERPAKVEGRAMLLATDGADIARSGFRRP